MLNEETNEQIMQIGSNIASMRKLLGLTARQVSERARVSQVTYSHIENGKSGVRLDNLLRVLDALGLADKVIDSTDPYKSDLGIARADLNLPERVRHK